MKNRIFLLLHILFVNVLVLHAQQDTSFWNREMIKIATLRSNADWINIKPGVVIDPLTFLTSQKVTLNLGIDDSMRLYQKAVDRAGFAHYKYQQYYKGYKIIFGEFFLHAKDERLVTANGKMIRGINKKVVITIGKETALQNALRIVPAAHYAWEIPQLEDNYKQIMHNESATYKPVGELVWVSNDQLDNLQDPSKYELAYMFDIYPASLEAVRVFISAANGKLVRSLPLSSHCNPTSVTTNFNGVQTIATKQTFLSNPPYYNLWNDCRSAFIRVQDWTNSTDYVSGINNSWAAAASPATSLWAVDRAYNYFLSVHQRDGWGSGGTGIIVYQNALFCTGDGCTPTNPGNASFLNGVMKIGNNGTPTNTIDDWNTVDIISHEFAHGVTASASGLVYLAESGALNESFSDIFGASSYNWFSNGTNPNIWLAGYDRQRLNGSHAYLRNMSNPNDTLAGTPSPDTYMDFGHYWVNTQSINDPGDLWGVHTNSGVQNFMYYLLVTGGSGTNDNGTGYNVIGIGIDKAQAIAYEALTYYINADAKYPDARNAWVHAAVTLYGSCSFEAIETGKAWYAVGLNPPSVDQTACGTITGIFSGSASGTYYLAPDCDLTINNGALAQYGAPKIVIGPHFKAQPGSYFTAYASDCRYAEY